MQIFKSEIEGTSITYSIRNSINSTDRSVVNKYYDRRVKDHYMGNRLFNFYNRVVYIIFDIEGYVLFSYIWGEL